MSRTESLATLTATGVILLLGLSVGQVQAQPEKTLDACQAKVAQESRKYVAAVTTTFSKCLRRVSRDMIRDGATDSSGAATTCAKAFRKISNSDRPDKTLSAALARKIGTACDPDYPRTKAEHTEADVLGTGALSQQIDALNLGAWCTRFGGSGSVDDIDVWVACIVAAGKCQAEQAIAMTYPRVLEWLADLRPHIDALDATDPDPAIVDALGVLDDLKADLDGDANGELDLVCGEPPAPPKSDGEVCGSASECISNFCVDGYCCNSACSSSCDRCDLSGSEGSCGIAPQGDGGAPSCSPYVCDGASASCPATCTSDGDCASGFSCNGSSQCVAKSSNGATCGSASECISNFCVDGYCCNSACSSECDRCNLSGSEGSCGVAPQGDGGAPNCSPYVCDGASASCPASCSSDGDCASGFYCNGSSLCVVKNSNGATCGSASECASNFCVDGYCCNSACSGNCDRCNLSGSEGSCSIAPQGDGGDPSCLAYVCDGASASCPATCSSNADCAVSFSCVGSTCQ